MANFSFKLQVIETYRALALIENIKNRIYEYSPKKLEELCESCLEYIEEHSFDAYE